MTKMKLLDETASNHKEQEFSSATDDPVPTKHGAKCNRKESEGNKKGNAGMFRDPQLKFFQNYGPDHCTISTKEEMQSFWAKVIPTYFKEFPWHLGKEPAELQTIPGEKKGCDSHLLIAFCPDAVAGPSENMSIDANNAEEPGDDMTLLDETLAKKRAQLLQVVQEQGIEARSFHYLVFIS